MNTRSLLAAIMLSGLGVAHSAESSITFSGVLTSDGITYVALTDPATKSTRWVRTGETFNGYAVARYDATAEAVYLRKGGEEFTLPLALAKSVEPPPAAPALASANVAPAAAATAAAIRANLRQLVTAALQLRSRLGVASVSYNDVVGPGKPVPALTPVAGETYSTLNFSADVTAVSVTTSDGATITLDLQAPAAPKIGVIVDPTPTPLPAGPAFGGPPAPAVNAAQAGTTPAAANTPATTGKQPPPITTVTGLPSVLNPATDAEEKLPATGRQPPSPSYTIQGGDTLQSIATANGVTMQQIQQLNPTLHGSSLRPGETIRIR